MGGTHPTEIRVTCCRWCRGILWRSDCENSEIWQQLLQGMRGTKSASFLYTCITNGYLSRAFHKRTKLAILAFANFVFRNFCSFLPYLEYMMLVNSITFQGCRLHWFSSFLRAQLNKIGNIGILVLWRDRENPFCLGQRLRVTNKDTTIWYLQQILLCVSDGHVPQAWIRLSEALLLDV